MAGKSGLNITRDEPPDAFRAAYGAAEDWLAPMLDAFGPREAVAWAEALGQPVFTGSTGRVFPEVMKASSAPARNGCGGSGRSSRLAWRWTRWKDGAWAFDTPGGATGADPPPLPRRHHPSALGGASWRRLGSDGAWAAASGGEGRRNRPRSARPNMGLSHRLDAALWRRIWASPSKSVRLVAGAQCVRGEAVISERGIEGGGVYAISAAVRDGAPFRDRPRPRPQRGGHRPTPRAAAERNRTLMKHLAQALRPRPLSNARFCRNSAVPLPEGADLARLIKALPVRHLGSTSHG